MFNYVFELGFWKVLLKIGIYCHENFLFLKFVYTDEVVVAFPVFCGAARGGGIRVGKFIFEGYW